MKPSCGQFRGGRSPTHTASERMQVCRRQTSLVGRRLGQRLGHVPRRVRVAVVDVGHTNDHAKWLEEVVYSTPDSPSPRHRPDTVPLVHDLVIPIMVCVHMQSVREDLVSNKHLSREELDTTSNRWIACEVTVISACHSALFQQRPPRCEVVDHGVCFTSNLSESTQKYPGA